MFELPIHIVKFNTEFHRKNIAVLQA